MQKKLDTYVSSFFCDPTGSRSPRWLTYDFYEIYLELIVSTPTASTHTHIRSCTASQKPLFDSLGISKTEPPQYIRITTVCFMWSHGESNPDFQDENLAS